MTVVPATNGNVDSFVLPSKPEKLSYKIKLAYGVGHVLNDLCSGMWFSYLLLYFQNVVLFSNSNAGIIILVGQVADAICTPFVGIESDRDDDFFLCKYGKRKTWHFVGTLCVILTFPFVFMRCIGCEDSSQPAQMFYYCMFVIIFQFGWASVQISHLSLIPDLTECQHERTELNAIRYAFLVGANMFDYGITWVILGMSDSGPDQKIGPKNEDQFRNIVLILLGVGSVFVTIFHVFTPERKIAKKKKAQMANNPNPCKKDIMKITDWFKEPQFYIVGMLYMATRLYMNLTQVYFSMYLQEYLQLGKTSIAIYPLIMYVTGFISSFGMKPLNRIAGRKITYAIGGASAIAASIWFQFGEGEQYKTIFLYITTVLAGIGSSTLLVTSLSITADLIGNNVESGAFVYGAMSFTDKLSNGVGVILIQNFYPCPEQGSLKGACGYYYRDVLSYGCGGTVVLGLIALAILIPYTIGERRKGLKEEQQRNFEAVTENGIKTISGSVAEATTPAVLPPAPSECNALETSQSL